MLRTIVREEGHTEAECTLHHSPCCIIFCLVWSLSSWSVLFRSQHACLQDKRSRAAAGEALTCPPERGSYGVIRGRERTKFPIPNKISSSAVWHLMLCVSEPAKLSPALGNFQIAALLPRATPSNNCPMMKTEWEYTELPLLRQSKNAEEVFSSQKLFCCLF